MGDNTHGRSVDKRSVTNVISGVVNHGVMVQAGSVEGGVHVHAPPGQSAERDAALGELEQRVAAHEQAEQEKQQRQDQEQREAQRRKEQQRRREARRRELESRVEASEERAKFIRNLLAGVLCVLALAVMVGIGVIAHNLWGFWLASLLICGCGIVAIIPTSALESRREKAINSASSRGAAPDFERYPAASWVAGRPWH